MGDIVILGALVAAGTAILARSPRLRLAASMLFVLLTVGALVQFSRASYASILAGFLVLIAIALFRAPAPMVVARKVVPALVLLAALVPVLGLVHPTNENSQSAAQVFAMRAESGIEEIQARSGTFGYRYNVQSKMLDVVGNRWPVGVGFWHPDDRFVSGLPSGSIRNGDVGVLNGITTIGAVGTVLLYLPVLGTILFLARRKRTGSSEWDGLIVRGQRVAVRRRCRLHLARDPLQRPGPRADGGRTRHGRIGRESPAQARRKRARREDLSLSVVIVTYRSDRCIEGALASVRSQLPRRRSSSSTMLRTTRRGQSSATFGGVRLVEQEENVGFGRACNTGARHATGTRVLFVNPDVRIVSAEPAELARSGPNGFGLLGGYLAEDPGSVPEDSLRGERHWLHEYVGQTFGLLRPREVALRPELGRDAQFLDPGRAPTGRQGGVPGPRWLRPPVLPLLRGQGALGSLSEGQLTDPDEPYPRCDARGERVFAWRRPAGRSARLAFPGVDRVPPHQRRTENSTEGRHFDPRDLAPSERRARRTGTNRSRLARRAEEPPNQGLAHVRRWLPGRTWSPVRSEHSAPMLPLTCGEITRCASVSSSGAAASEERRP